MISYLKGQITFKSPTYLVVEVAGVGYHINISLHTYSQIERQERVKILTHLQVREDSHTLFGFADELERKTFVQLISVSGIGATTAQVVLSTLSPDEVRSAIVGENVATFSKVKGIGAKTAKRIILDLKDKILKEGGVAPAQLPALNNTMREEALSALVALGFNKISVQKVLNRIAKSQPGISRVEELIKVALKELS